MPGHFYFQQLSLSIARKFDAQGFTFTFLFFFLWGWVGGGGGVVGEESWVGCIICHSKVRSFDKFTLMSGRELKFDCKFHFWLHIWSQLVNVAL